MLSTKRERMPGGRTDELYGAAAPATCAADARAFVDTTAGARTAARLWIS